VTRQAGYSTALAILIALGLGASEPASAQITPEASAIETRIGPIPLRLELPADQATVQKLYDELDAQRASQAYIWALPLVSFAEWQHAARTVFGAHDTDMVVYSTLRDKMGILTANATTPYIGGFPDLSRTGPLVIDYPAGATAGGVGDFWQRPLTDMGETGPDSGKGGKYLILGPGQDAPKDSGYRVIRSSTSSIFVAFRVLEPDPAKGKALLALFHMYPFKDRAHPPATRFLAPEGRSWSQVPPSGMGYWERLDAAIQSEPVQERDRIMMAMLKPLGIEKGRAFKPDARQTKLLLQGAQLGELMAQAISFRSRAPDVHYQDGTHWEFVLGFDPSQESQYYTQLDERTNWFYQAVTATKGMATKTPDVGQAYLGASADKDGNWLDGGKSYRLHVPPDPPAKLFWSVTLYDALTRVFVDNRQDVADRSSRQDPVKNGDGSVDLYFGPQSPASGEKNWIQTVPGRAWFAYLRLYGPTRAYFDRAWPLPDIEAVP
jgi:hypothetical protein